MYFVDSVEIHDNQFTNINSDGMYVEQATNVEILRNTITGATADAIDIDGIGEGYYSSSFIITHNVFTDIGDVGFEIDELQGATIAHNTLEVADEGIDVGDSQDIEFTNNTITPTNRSMYQIPSVSTQSVPLDIGDAEVQLSAVFDTLSYTLPFTFNFQGRDITAISANTNGAIELFENAETCDMCGSGGGYAQNLYSDTIFASFDLIDVSGEGDYVAVFNRNDESVVVEWKGTTFVDSNSVEHPVHFQVELFPNGTVEWNFIQMNFEGYNGSMFTGVYDVETDRLYRAGSAIRTPSSYRADMSGNTSYPSMTAYDVINGVRLFNVSNMVITGNTIQAELWVDTEEGDNITFNDSDSGNTYLFTNGAGAWTQFDIVDTDGNGYAESGTDRPFSNATLGSQYWMGGDADAFPRVIASTSTPPVPVVVTVAPMSSGGFQSGVSSTLFNRPRATSTAVTAGVPVVPNRTPVSTTRDLQRFLNTNGFPVALTGPGSLNNETGVFGTRTRQALMRFQKANGIVPALGIFGPITKAFINSSVEASAPVGSSTSTSTSTPASTPVTPSSDDELNLTVGSTGVSVTRLQEFLISAGFPIADGATGRFGQQTRRALMTYQNANKIIPATGTFGPLTRAHMKNTLVAELWW
jgi:peptidoglycan hydrolase-like protein with peptidoglycan-binding domain